MYEFTVAEILDAAEKGKYPNNNDSFISYKVPWSHYPVDIEEVIKDEPHKVATACVIGEAFLQLGMVENGVDAEALSRALQDVRPDNGSVTIDDADYTTWGGHIETNPQTFRNLSDFINNLNSHPRYRGKKRIVKLARKYFSKSLDQVVRLEENV